MVNNNYGSTTNPTADVFYPTITAEDGKSTSAGVKNLKYTFYSYYKSKVASQVQDMLFTGNNYFLSSRCVNTISSSATFNVRLVISSSVNGRGLCFGISTRLREIPFSNCAVRPLVSLKSEVIDIDAGYDETTGWKLK